MCWRICGGDNLWKIHCNSRCKDNDILFRNCPARAIQYITAFLIRWKFRKLALAYYSDFLNGNNQKWHMTIFFTVMVICFISSKKVMNLPSWSNLQFQTRSVDSQGQISLQRMCRWWWLRTCWSGRRTQRTHRWWRRWGPEFDWHLLFLWSWNHRG